MTPRPPLVDPMLHPRDHRAYATSRFRMERLGVSSEPYMRLQYATQPPALDRVFRRTVELHTNPAALRGSVLYHGLALEDGVFRALWRRRA